MKKRDKYRLLSTLLFLVGSGLFAWKSPLPWTTDLILCGAISVIAFADRVWNWGDD